MFNNVQDDESHTAIDQSELFELLLPGFYQEDLSNDDILNPFVETQVNSLIRRSFVRPFEKQLAHQIGLNDLKFDYNLGQELFNTGTDSQDLGIQFIRNVFTDQLVLRIKTDIDLDEEDDSSTDTVELSEVELTYFILKNKSLSFNYSNVKQEDENAYLSKLSLRYRYEY